MNGLPVAAAVSEVLSLFKQRFHQRTANAGVAVSVDSVGEPRTGNADLGGVAALYYAVVSLTPFLHCFHGMPVSMLVLLLVSRRRQQVAALCMPIPNRTFPASPTVGINTLVAPNK